jgi:hypothetical protein
MKQPFRFNIDPAPLEDLRVRLAATRWPDEIDNAKRQYGNKLKYLQSLCDNWQKRVWLEK